jgi:hypothetical protein
MHHCKRGKRWIGRNFTIGLLLLASLPAGPVRADTFSIPTTPRTDPPAVLVRLAPEMARGLPLGSRIRLESLSPGLAAIATELGVQSTQAPYEDVFVGAPTEGPPDGPEARLRRTLRLVLPQGADARAPPSSCHRSRVEAPSRTSCSTWRGRQGRASTRTTRCSRTGPSGACGTRGPARSAGSPEPTSGRRSAGWSRPARPRPGSGSSTRASICTTPS